MDITYLIGIFLFAAITLLIIKGCSRLGGDK
ncbi:hypothetical protein S2091_4073 [Solimicrobium silvestre]|uniref:Uncharacterized protein n=1 Tax=Solimicrobium silvestre TaxID=2099400 RepID=A0A2S9GTZ3_9BURK|nr:hypothetical protein S2091_4073 [Solimicrobium silvestre]